MTISSSFTVHQLFQNWVNLQDTSKSLVLFLKFSSADGIEFFNFTSFRVISSVEGIEFLFLLWSSLLLSLLLSIFLSLLSSVVENSRTCWNGNKIVDRLNNFEVVSKFLVNRRSFNWETRIEFEQFCFSIKGEATKGWEVNREENHWEEVNEWIPLEERMKGRPMGGEGLASWEDLRGYEMRSMHLFISFFDCISFFEFKYLGEMLLGFFLWTRQMYLWTQQIYVLLRTSEGLKNWPKSSEVACIKKPNNKKFEIKEENLKLLVTKADPN